MSPRSKVSILLAAVLAFSSAAYAAPTFYLGYGVLPGELGNLTAARGGWQTAAALGGGSLAMEGFEAFAPGNPIDFGAFTTTLFDGDGFGMVSGNTLVTTEGNSIIDFFTTGTTAVEFSFDGPINYFGVDITSIDFAPPTTVSFLDNQGNVLNDFAIHDIWAGATFFGVVNDQAFSTARFNFTGSEWIGFDYLEYGTAIPEPGTISLVGLGLAGAAGALRRKRAKRG